MYERFYRTQINRFENVLLLVFQYGMTVLPADGLDHLPPRKFLFTVILTIVTEPEV